MTPPLHHRASLRSPPAAVPLLQSRRPGRKGSRDASCHSRRVVNSRAAWPVAQRWVWAVLLGLLLCGHRVGASEAYTAAPLDVWGGMVFDMREPPTRPMPLAARQDAATSSLPSRTTAPTRSASATEDSASHTATATSQSSLPSPFDTSLGQNFTTATCPTFFHAFLNNATFQQCLPLSLLLQTSNSFFLATQSLVHLTQTLDATCAVDFPTCSSLMASLARELQAPQNCGVDFRLQNPTVRQAYNGFIAYEPLYRAGCLTDPTDGSYCFANAITNTSAPTSSYIYYLPVGVQLPAGFRPACSMCLQSTMAIFAAAAGNSSVPLGGNYGAAAQQVDVSCGPSFVVAEVEQTSGSGRQGMSAGLGLWILLAAALMGLVG